MEIPNEDTEKDKDKKPEVTSSGSSTSPQEDKFEVRINSYQLADIFGKIAVHNEVAFYRNGEPLIAFNGNAHNKQTGELNTFAIQPNHTLKVSAAKTTYEQQGLKLVGSVSFGTLTREEFAEKLKVATTAANFINDNKLDYVIVGGPYHEAQNSNSVATALLQSMDYKYPEKEFGHLWAPGSKRPLLPDDWSSQDMTQDDFIRLLEKLERDEVSNNIKNDKNLIPIHDPEISNFPDLFKPNETSVPYNKKVTPDIPQTEPNSRGFKSASEQVITTDCNLSEKFGCAASNDLVTNNPDNVSKIAQARTISANDGAYLNHGTGGP